MVLSQVDHYGGLDFNVDIAIHQKHKFGKELINFCKDEGLIIGA